ncbi:MAG: hypothetical protein JWO82_2944, partial [Akkermansiaceae bacterium]|nr:hypothetical protein [Akkermansiaceae bacterium]
MANAYGWRGSRETIAPRTASSDNLGWWAGVAFLAAIIIHVVAFLALGRIQIALGLKEAPEIRTAQVKVDHADVNPDEYRTEVKETPPPAAPKINSLVDEVDVLSKLPEPEVEIKPQIKDAQFAMSLEAPLESGAPQGVKIDPVAGINLNTDLPEIGRTPEAPLSVAAEGQITIDPGKGLPGGDSIDKFTEDIIKKGAGGKSDKGTLDGVVTLDDMLGLPANVLVGKKTMLPGDLLFDYNSADLRESARVGLMKLALLISNNPTLYCWIEGYTDLYGGDSFNLDLSLRRADSVRRYLTGTLHLPEEKILTRGFGKTMPLVREGGVEAQSMNRRVEIKLRRTTPPAQIAVAPSPVHDELPPPPRAKIAGSEAAPAAKPVMEDPPRKDPVLVKPKRAIEVEEVTLEPEHPQTPPPARPVQTPPRAKPLPEP